MGTAMITPPSDAQRRGSHLCCHQSNRVHLKKRHLFTIYPILAIMISTLIQYKNFARAFTLYLPLLKHQQRLSQSSQEAKRVAQASSKIGFYYLSAIAYQHLLIFNSETEQACEAFIATLLKTIQKNYGVTAQNFAKLVYKTFFYEDSELRKGFIQQIRGLLTQARYQNVFTSTREKEAYEEKQNGILDTANQTITSTVTREEQEQSVVEQKSPYARKVLEMSSCQIDLSDLKRKLNGFCTPAQTKMESVEEYLSKVSNARTEMSQLCHQLGINQPQLAKYPIDKLFKVVCKLDITSKYTKNKRVVYEEEAIESNSKVAATRSTYKLLLRLYADYPQIWEQFKEAKRVKKLKT